MTSGARLKAVFAIVKHSYQRQRQQRPRRRCLDHGETSEDRNTAKIAFFGQNRASLGAEDRVISKACTSNSLRGGSMEFFMRSTNSTGPNKRKTTENSGLPKEVEMHQRFIAR
jgi:hypothetical protein